MPCSVQLFIGVQAEVRADLADRVAWAEVAQVEAGGSMEKPGV